MLHSPSSAPDIPRPSFDPQGVRRGDFADPVTPAELELYIRAGIAARTKSMLRPVLFLVGSLVATGLAWLMFAAGVF